MHRQQILALYEIASCRGLNYLSSFFADEPNRHTLGIRTEPGLACWYSWKGHFPNNISKGLLVAFVRHQRDLLLQDTSNLGHV